LSDLAVHTRNLRADPRASLLFDGTGSAAEPLTGPRASLEGVIEVVDPAAVQERYFVRHPDAKAYSGFKDFRFYRLQVERAHLVEGFGRIIEVPALQILQPANVLKAGWSDIALALQVVADLIKNTNCHVVDLDPDGFELDSGYGRAWYPYLRTVSRSAEAPGAVQEALASGAGQAE
jgi:putative heme iron utilization protein